MRLWIVALCFLTAGCAIPVRFITENGAELCVAEWSKEYADKAGGAVDALPLDSPIREGWAQFLDLRKKVKRCHD